MNKEDLFANMKYRLETSYPQYKFTIKENALVMNNKTADTNLFLFTRVNIFLFA